MTRTIKRRVAALVGVVALLSVGDLVVVPLASDQRPLCERASDWVETHRNSLPTTLKDLSRFPVAYRSAIQNALSPETRARLWTEQLSAFAGRPDLTPHQRATVQELRAMVNPHMYIQEPQFDALREDTQRIAAAKVAEAFGTSEAVDTFRELGPPEPVASLGRGGLVQLSEMVRGLFATDAAQTPNCQCFDTEDCNRPGRIHGPCTWGSCTVVYTCGFFANTACGGRCLG
jgi:hypothetical protein